MRSMLYCLGDGLGEAAVEAAGVGGAAAVEAAGVGVEPELHPTTRTRAEAAARTTTGLRV